MAWRGVATNMPAGPPRPAGGDAPLSNWRLFSRSRSAGVLRGLNSHDIAFNGCCEDDLRGSETFRQFRHCCDVYYSAVTPQLGDTEWADG